MTAVLGWCLGDCGSVTSPAVNSPEKSQPFGFPSVQEATNASAPLPRARSLPCCQDRYLLVSLNASNDAEMGLICNWIGNEKVSPCSHFNFNVQRELYFSCVCFCVFQYQLPSSPFSFANAVGGLLEVKLGSCGVPSQKGRLKPLLGFGERCSSGLMHCTRAHIAAPPTLASSWREEHMGWPPPPRGRGGGGEDAQTPSLL